MNRIDARLIDMPLKKSGTLNEKETWELYGCNDREEWCDLLNRWLWKEYTMDIKDDCYIGTHESNLRAYKRRAKEDDID